MIRKILLSLTLLSSSLFADYYDVRARAGSALIYSSEANAVTGASRSTSTDAKGKTTSKKTYIAKLGDLSIRKVRFVSESNDVIKITFFDIRARNNYTGYVRASEVRKVLIKEIPTEEEKKAAKENRKSATSLKISVKVSTLKTLKSSFNLKDEQEIKNFISDFSSYQERHQVNLKTKKQILAQQSTKLAKLSPKLKDLENKNKTLKTEADTQQKKTVELTESNTKLKDDDKEHDKQIKDLELEVSDLKDQKEAELKAAKKQAYIWAAIAGILGFFVSTKLFNRS